MEIKDLNEAINLFIDTLSTEPNPQGVRERYFAEELFGKFREFLQSSASAFELAKLEETLRTRDAQVARLGEQNAQLKAALDMVNRKEA